MCVWSIGPCERPNTTPDKGRTSACKSFGYPRRIPPPFIRGNPAGGVSGKGNKTVVRPKGKVMTQDKLEYWHEKLWELVVDMKTSPIEPGERASWVTLLEAVGVARLALRQLHGDWINTEAFARQEKRWER